MAKLDTGPYQALIGQTVKVDILGIHQFISKLTAVRTQTLTGLPYPPDRRVKDDKAYTPPVMALDFEDHCPIVIVREDFTLVGIPDGLALVLADMRKITLKVHYEID